MYNVELAGTGKVILMAVQGPSEKLLYRQTPCSPAVLKGSSKAKNLMTWMV